ncbi:MAG: hypothetical protein N2594_01855 [Clostridiales bacterium]|nr:hypothetical protein [Clostridiales bacterium]
MKVKRFYNLEIKFMLRKISIGLLPIIVLLIVLLSLKDNETIFEKSFKERDYRALYNMIDNRDFSFDVFQKYMEYNFPNDTVLKNKVEDKQKTTLTYTSKKGDKVVILQKNNGKLNWKFDDYVYDWTIKVPLQAKVQVCGEDLENKDGVVLIKKIPFALYEVKITLQGCEDYNNKVLAGQKIEVKLDLAEEVIERCKETIGEYLKFKENAIQNKKVEEVQCLYNNSGLYTEVLNEIEWLNSIDYKYEKKLLGFELLSAKLKYSGVIEIDVKENWQVKVKTDEMENTNSTSSINKYIVEIGDSYKITQINTIQ